jgi:L-fuconolactonase
MRIDSHQHFWDLGRFHYSWMPPPPSRIHRNFLPENLAPLLDLNRFDGSVLVQANTLLEESRWLLELASANPFILGVVGWADLTSPQLGAALDEFQRHPRFKGVLGGLREVARRGLPYDLLLRPQHLPLVPRLAEAVPELRMVIDHIAKPPIAAGWTESWARDMERAAELPRVSCKLSGMITEAAPNWAPSDLRPYVLFILERFGPDRLMYGSDWPVCLLAGNFKRALAAFTQALAPVPTPVRNKIMGETACAFYGLTASPA